jgi:mannan endo-1,4-beta-mannosidase
MGAAVTAAIARPWPHDTIHTLPPVRYVGVHEPDAPSSYYQESQFAQAIGMQPNIVSYYSRWTQAFQVDFATSAAEHGALTVVQIDPATATDTSVSLANIATGRYDDYFRSFAEAVKAFRTRIVISFGHEMNGNWYSWGYRHTPAKVFVAAWRHIVTLFRTIGATNVSWLWTINVMDENIPIPIPNPKPWWPGSSYVDWVGIDGYYSNSSSAFESLFGPTITAVRAITEDPILIAETGAPPTAGQPAKINDLFSGIRTYGLLGFIYFDENTQGRVWRINNPQAFAAFRQGATSLLVRRQPLESGRQGRTPRPDT